MAERRQRGLLFDDVLPQARRTVESLLSLEPQEDASTAQQAIEAALGFVPGIGQAMALRDIERARRAGDPAAAAMAATEFLPFGRLAGMMRRPGPIMSEIDVYHGSPHRFEEFDASKIGTGEGAQAYGHGIYFAESPKVARGYREALSGGDRGRFVEKQGRRLSEVGEAEGFENLTAQDLAARIAAQYNGDIGKAVAETKSILQSTPKGYARDLRSKALRELQRNKDQYEGASWVEPGALYTADLPDEMVDRMLDWDKPLREQPAAVREAFQDIMQSNLWDEETRKLISKVAIEADEITGKKLYELLASSDELAGKGPFGKAASEELARRGVPGIKYLDAGSRGQGGTGTRNFVVFPGEEKKVKILKRE